MFVGKHFQNAYITRDIEKAVTDLCAQAGIDKGMWFEADVEVTTPKGRGPLKNKLAFIWINGIQYELIEPVSGLCDVYSDELPDDDTMRFHHICMRVDEWGSFREQVENQPLPVILEGGDENLRFLYLDARDTVGHYLEYVWMTPERWQQVGGQ